MYLFLSVSGLSLRYMGFSVVVACRLSGCDAWVCSTAYRILDLQARVIRYESSAQKGRFLITGLQGSLKTVTCLEIFLAVIQ